MVRFGAKEGNISRFKIAVLSRRQPEGQHQKGEKFEDELHEKLAATTVIA